MFTVIYDACVLHSPALRDLFLRVAEAGLCRARWSEEILEECFQSILRRRPDLVEAKLLRTRGFLRTAIPDCMVAEADYKPLIDVLTLPDAKDRHVLAAAICSGAQEILTANLRDFPQTVLARYNIEARHPDDFLLRLLTVQEGAVIQLIKEQQAGLKSPPRSMLELLDTLHGERLIKSVARLRELL